MITAHPSEQLKETVTYMTAWLVVGALLVILASYSGRTGLGIAAGIAIGALIVLVQRTGHITPAHPEHPGGPG